MTSRESRADEKRPCMKSSMVVRYFLVCKANFRCELITEDSTYRYVTYCPDSTEKLATRKLCLPSRVWAILSSNRLSLLELGL